MSRQVAAPSLDTVSHQDWFHFRGQVITTDNFLNRSLTIPNRLDWGHSQHIDNNKIHTTSRLISFPRSIDSSSTNFQNEPAISHTILVDTHSHYWLAFAVIRRAPSAADFRRRRRLRDFFAADVFTHYFIFISQKSVYQYCINYWLVDRLLAFQ